MAITHNDLARRTRRSADISSRLALFLVVLSVLCGILSFVLCLAAEASRTEATWFNMNDQSSVGDVDVCTFTGSGKTPLAAAVCAFILLAVAMFAEHAYMLVAVTSPRAPSLWAVPNVPTPTPAPPSLAVAASTATALTWQACCLFLTTWISFGIAEVLLIIGIGIESGHLNQWSKARPVCHIVRPGVFASAGIFGLITVLLGVGLYLTALQTQKLQLEDEYIRQGMPQVAGHHYPSTAPRQPHALQAHQIQSDKATDSV